MASLTAVIASVHPCCASVCSTPGALAAARMSMTASLMLAEWPRQGPLTIRSASNTLRKSAALSACSVSSLSARSPICRQWKRQDQLHDSTALR